MVCLDYFNTLAFIQVFNFEFKKQHVKRSAKVSVKYKEKEGEWMFTFTFLFNGLYI